MDVLNCALSKMSAKSKNQKKTIPPIKGKDFWGPPIWTSTHILAATLRPENGEWYKKYLECLSHLLPCEECKKNLKTKLSTHPPDAYMSNNHDAFFYSYLLHDLANEHISLAHPATPPKESPDYDQTKAFYFGGLAQECKDCQV